MAFYVNSKNALTERTLKPLYSYTQATLKDVNLDPEYDVSKGDIFPGTVMKSAGENLVTVAGEGDVPVGLAATWHAPVYGISEVTHQNTPEIKFTLAVLGNDAEFKIHAPAFDVEADWTAAVTKLEEGTPVYLKANANGLLTVETSETGEPTKATAARFLGTDGSNVIIVGGL